MCGYVRRHITNRNLRKFLDQMGMPGLFPDTDEGELKHFYPAFGGVASRVLEDVIMRRDAGIQKISPTWWFDCAELNGELIVGKRTTFNARNLESAYWKGAIRHNRGIAVATGIGESLQRDGKKFQYLMESEKPLLLGCVYRRFPNELYSCAVITRDEHDRFGKYHDKAFPLMLPYDKEFLELWLSDEREDHPAIAHLLSDPKIFTDLKVTPVKTFKAGEAVGAVEHLAAD